MSYSSVVLADSPLGYWRLNDPAGTVMADSSGNGRDGVYESGARTTGLLTEVDDGHSGKASVPDGAWMAPLSAISVECWFKTEGSALQALIGRSRAGDFGTSAAGTYRLYLNSGQLAFQVFDTSFQPIVTVSGGSNLHNNQTHHVVATWDGSTAKLYVDGALAGTASGSGTMGSTAMPLFIGYMGHASSQFPVLGTLDEPAIYDHALTQARAEAHYLAGTGTAIEDVTATLSGVARRPVGAFAIEVPEPPPSLSLAGTLRPLVGSFTATASPPGPALTLAGQVQRPVATFTGNVEAPFVAPVEPTSPMVKISATAHGPVTMQGAQPVFSTSKASIVRARQRIVIDGRDVTDFRGVTMRASYTLLEPLLYGPGNIEMPQIAACFERLGVSALSWLRVDAPVEVQRVLDEPGGPVVVGVDWRGFIVAFDASGKSLSVECGGEANGRAAIRDWQRPIFPRINDLGRQGSHLIRSLGLPFEPQLGPVTGIEMMTTGGVSHLDQIEAVISSAWTRAGRQWSIMPDRAGVYRMARKDDTTHHATVFFDDSRTVPNLRRDKAEEPNRIFASAVAPNGMRINGAVYPGLIQGKAPEFPGHMKQGDSGPYVRMLILKLQSIGYLKLEDAEGGYDDDVVRAVKQLQDDADLNKTGEVNEATWRALYDLDVTTLSVEGAHIEPMAQRSKVREWNRSGSGNIMGPNPNYDPSVVPVDRTIDMGQAGMNVSQVREVARTVLWDADDPNWVGTIQFKTRGLIRGKKSIGATLTSADVMDARALKPGMNIWAPAFDGGTLFHVAACEIDAEGIVTATVDTRFRDAMEVWEIIARNRESRSDPARSLNRKHRASTLQKDSIGEWDQVGGMLGQDIELEAGWTVFEVVAAQEGTIARIAYDTVPAAETVVAVFGEKVGPGLLRAKIGNPLTKAGAKEWARESTRRELEKDYELLYVAGDSNSPCGYYPKAKRQRNDEDSAAAPLTGRWKDDAGFTYRSRVKHLVWVAVWSDRPSKIPAGRIMWPQLEAGV